MEQLQSFLIVFINPRSGACDGKVILESLATLLPAEQVVDLHALAQMNEEEKDRKIATLAEMIARQTKQVRIIVGGGDGSVSWVSKMIAAALQGDCPPVAIMPLGTGNELSRRIGWGKEYSPKMDLKGYLIAVDRGLVAPVDSWTIDFSTGNQSFAANTSLIMGPDEDALGEDGGADAAENNDAPDHEAHTSSSSWTQSMSCFLSVGYDAFIAHKFHLLREKSPKLASTRSGNKLWHVWFGLGVIFKRQPVLHSLIDLEIDGTRIEIPESVRCIHVLNIRTTGDGLDLFRSANKPRENDLIKEYQPQSHSDGLIEVVATTGPLNLVKLRMMKKSHAIRLGQGKDIKLSLKSGRGEFPMQIEGEPFLQQTPCEVHIHSPIHKQYVIGPKKPDSVPNQE